MNNNTVPVTKRDFSKYNKRTGFPIPKDLMPLIDAAKRDKELLICLRGNEIHIYYRGGKILGLNPGKLSFDLKYLTGRTDRDNLICADIKKHKNTIMSNPDAFFSEAKSVMNEWFKQHPKQERDDQHQIALRNQVFSSESGLIVIDIEFATSFLANYYNKQYIDPEDKIEKERVTIANARKWPRYPSPRFDIIAIDKSGRIHVLELKTGLNALGNAKTHVEDFNALVGNQHQGDNPNANELRFISFIKEIQEMVAVLNKEHLRESLIPTPIMSKPIFHFVFTAKGGAKAKPEEYQISEFPKKIKASLDLGVDICKIDRNKVLSLQ